MNLDFSRFLDATTKIKPGLPARAYTSEEFRRLENQRLFASNWVFVGFAHEIPNPGDVHPVTPAGQPVFLVRNEEKEITAFYNVCSHRCLQLVPEPGNCGSGIQCPYHAWSYTLTGELKATPFFTDRGDPSGSGFSMQDNGLKPVRCATWHDWVFVNLDGNAPELADYIQPLVAQLGDLSIDQIKPIGTIDFGIVNCNWKLLMENFIEPYHVQFVHKTTTKQPLVTHRTVIREHCLGSVCDIDDEAVTAVDKETTLAVSSQFMTLFPNFVIGAYAPDQVGVHLNTPVSAEQTRQKRVLYVHKDRDMSETGIERLKRLWYEVHKEDHAMCERLQAGRHATVAESGGYLSNRWEDSVRRFQEMVVEYTVRK